MNLCEIMLKSDQRFQEEEDPFRLSSCLYIASSSHSPELCFLTDQNFAIELYFKI